MNFYCMSFIINYINHFKIDIKLDSNKDSWVVLVSNNILHTKFISITMYNDSIELLT